MVIYSYRLTLYHDKIWSSFSFIGFYSFSFCGKDFLCLGRHSWRCKEKYKIDNNYHDKVNERQNRLLLVDENHHERSLVLIKCSCGKKCKGQRGLKAHQRSCKVIKGLHGELFEYVNENENNIPDDNIANIEDLAERMTSIIYSFFKDAYGVTKVMNSTAGVFDKYNDLSNGQLKKKLNQLKKSKSNIAEIKYVSSLLRNNLKGTIQKDYGNDEDQNHIFKQGFGHI